MIETLAKKIRQSAKRFTAGSATTEGLPSSALQCVIASNKFGSYCVPKASLHRPAARAILQAGVWEPETIAFIRDRCGSGDIVHAGTYFGDFLPGICAALADGAMVWAFEPNSENYRCASVTVKLNGLENRIKLTHAALGPVPGTVKISVLSDSGHPLGGASHIGGTGNESVAQIALDAFVPAERRVSILQLDVEKYEEMALRGAEKLIRRDRPILILETNPTGEWFDGLLEECGYVFERNLAENSAFVAGGERFKHA